MVCSFRKEVATVGERGFPLYRSGSPCTVEQARTRPVFLWQYHKQTTAEAVPLREKLIANGIVQRAPRGGGLSAKAVIASLQTCGLWGCASFSTVDPITRVKFYTVVGDTVEAKTWGALVVGLWVICVFAGSILSFAFLSPDGL